MPQQSCKQDQVSVVIPTYNGAKFIRSALESVFCQTQWPREVIVVDDASTDGTLDVVASILPHAPVRVLSVRLRTNSGGPAHPQNVGVGAASGELIAILDQDDVFLPNKIEEQAKALMEQPQVSMTLSSRDVENASGGVMRETGLAALAHLHADLGNGYYLLPGRALLRVLLSEWGLGLLGGFPAIMFRRRDWQRKRGFDESLRIAADTDFACWLCTEGAVAFFDRVHYRRNLHAANSSRANRILTFLEDCKAKARYLRQEPEFLKERGMARHWREQIKGAAYWSKQQGLYRDAFDYYRLLIKLWGLRPDCLGGLGKLLLAWCLKNPPTVSGCQGLTKQTE